MDVKTAFRKGMFVERNVAGSYQCACGEVLKKASLSGHLESKKHLEEFTVQTALEKNIFLQKENETYQCACGRRLKKASLKVHLTTMVHLAEVHARKLWMKPGNNTEPDDVSATSADDEEDEPDDVSATSADDEEGEDVKTALRKGMFVERNVAGSYQCACGEVLKKANLSGHLESKKHLEEFTVQTALEKNIFQQKENETYQCACGRRLKKASLKVHLTTMVHLAEVHAKKLWIKPGENTEPDDVNVTSTDDEEDEDVLDLDGQFKRCSYCKERFPNDESLAKHMKDQKHESYINRNQESLHTTNDSKQHIPPYTVKSDPRGHVYVFNNDFKGSASLRERRGAKVDSQNLKRTFTKMGYKVFLMENLGAERMKEEVAKIRDDPSLAFVDALVMVILSHGKQPYKCQAQDGATLDIREIRRNFTPSMCPNFKDKPKIFLMNYCRGKERQTVQTDGIEATRDMATIYATQHGVSALRNRREGTHFVKALCSVLRKYAASDTLRTIYLKLEKEMKQNKGTTPQWEDDAFRDFYFMPTVASAGM